MKREIEAYNENPHVPLRGELVLRDPGSVENLDVFASGYDETRVLSESLDRSRLNTNIWL